MKNLEEAKKYFGNDHFAVATNTPDCHVVTSTSQITYLGTVKGDTLISES